MGGSDFPGVSAETYKAFKQGLWKSKERKGLGSLPKTAADYDYKPEINGKRFLHTTIVMALNAATDMTQGLKSGERAVALKLHAVELWEYATMLLGLKHNWGVHEWRKFGKELMEKVLELQVSKKMTPDKVAAIKSATEYRVPAEDRKLYWDSILEQVTQELRRQRGGVLERELLRQKQGDNGDKAAAETMFAVLGVEGDPAPPEPATATATADPPGAAAASASEPNSSCHIPSTQKVCEESFMRQKPKTSLQGFKQLLQGIKVRCQTAGTAAGQTIARAAAAPFARQTRSSSRISRKADRQVPISSSPPPPTRQTLASTNTPPSSCPSMQERMYMVVDQVRGTCHFSICNVVNTTNQALVGGASVRSEKFADAEETATGPVAELLGAVLKAKEAAVACIHDVDSAITKQPAKVWQPEVMQKLCLGLYYSTGVDELDRNMFKLDEKEKSLPCGGSAGEFAVRVVQDKMGEEYAAKSFALVAAPKDGSMEKDTFGRSDDNQHSELPPAVGLHMADVSYVANEISFQRALATQTLGLVVPVQGWFLEVIKRAGYCVLCITMVMPFTGYDLLVCKRLLVSSPMFSSLGGPDKLTHHQQLVLTGVVWCVAKDVGQALAAIHEAQTRHGDIKMKNIVVQGSYYADNATSLLRALITSQSRCQLLDLGSASAARMIFGNIVFSNPRTDGCTDDMLAPEYIETDAEKLKNVAVLWAQKADVWALGMTLVLTLFWGAGILSKGRDSVYRSDIGRYAKLPDGSDVQNCKGRKGVLARRDAYIDTLIEHSRARGYLDNDLIAIIRLMLHEDPEKRLGAEGVINWEKGLVLAKVEEFQQKVKALLG